MLEYYTSSHAAVVEGNSLAANSLLEISYQKLESSSPGCWAKEGDMVTGEKRCFWSGGSAELRTGVAVLGYEESCKQE